MPTSNLIRRGLMLAGVTALLVSGWNAADATPQAPSAPALSTATGTSQTEIYTGVEPCRLFDTRVVGPEMTGTARSFEVSGNLNSQGGSATCDIPTNATSIAVNLTGIANAQGGGYVRAWAFGSPPATATVLNYAHTIDASNMVNLPLCRGTGCTDAITVRNFGVDMDIVGDILGYYTLPMYGQVRSTGQLSNSSSIESTALASTGNYTVIFDRPITQCSVQVTGYPSGAGPRFAVNGVGSNPNAVTVQAWNAAGMVANQNFTISATC